MARESIEKVIERSKRAWKEKDMWQSTLQDCYQYALPGRNLYLETSPGELKNEVTYDSTLVASVQRACNQYQTELFPPGEDWAVLVPGRSWKVFAVDESMVISAQRMLEEVTQMCFGILHASNFDIAVGEFLPDWIISTGILLKNKGQKGKLVDFCCVPLHQVALECDAYGRTTGIFRNFKMKARDIEPHWRKMGFKASEEFDNFAKEKPNEIVDVMEVTCYDYSSGDWNYEVILKGKFGTSGEYIRVVEHSYRVNPWIVVPYSRVAGESIGRGPVMSALPDARVLNKTKELTLKAASLAIFPPLMVMDDGVINFSTVKMLPGAPIPVGRNDGALGPSIKPLVTGENFSVSDLVISDHQAIIRRTMNDDVLPEQSGAVRSATEYMARMRDGQRNSAPRARLLVDFYRPLFQNLVETAREEGYLLEIMRKHGFDGDTIMVDGMFADVTVTSPMFQSRSLDRLDAVAAALQLALSLPFEMASLGLKVEELPKEIWESLGLPSKYVRTPEEREELEQNVATILAAQQQPQTA